MQFTIDYDEAGHRHFIETDPSLTGKVTDPTNPTQQIDIVMLLSCMNGRKDLQEAGGWLVVNQLPDEDKPTTRWDRMVKAIKQSNDSRAKEALGL